MLIEKIKKLSQNESMRYLIAGGLTTLISLLSFYLFLKISIDYRIATIFSFIISATFAFFSNKTYVFRHKSENIKTYIYSYFTFISSRLFTLAIDFFGMIVFVNFFNISEMVSKIILNIIIFVLNYVISKIIIFKNK